MPAKGAKVAYSAVTMERARGDTAQVTPASDLGDALLADDSVKSCAKTGWLDERGSRFHEAFELCFQIAVVLRHESTESGRVVTSLVLTIGQPAAFTQSTLS